MKVLVTGGAGYLGSHACIALREAGFAPVVVDNFANSRPAVLDRLAQITGEAMACERGDGLDARWVEQVLARHRVGAVLHFAGHKSVAESVAQPLKYYRNNVGGMVSLLDAMADSDCRTLVVSSSAAVYDASSPMPATEDSRRGPANPYGHTKLVIEDLLAALVAADPTWRVAVLRYFTAAGAHPSGLIGEDPRGAPDNLLLNVAQAAVGRRPFVSVYGNDYPTRDGTGVRDYVHVQDLAAGHVAALRALMSGERSLTVNLGTGRAHSVLEVVQAFERASGRPIPCRTAPRRPGDVAECYADPSLAQSLLGWCARRTLDDICADAWRWQRGNPGGYPEP
ncbi:UDP-glucose 4-epimerase [Burkholderiales bacterium]|nr:UDP-glucose 4-epimerase [Burkholderiales bacterium]